MIHQDNLHQQPKDMEVVSIVRAISGSKAVQEVVAMDVLETVGNPGLKC